MALSDQLTKLAAKANEAEDRAAAAQTQAKADLELAVKNARESAQTNADQLRKDAETDKDVLSAWWDDMQRTWNEHIATVIAAMGRVAPRLGLAGNLTGPANAQIAQ